MLAWLDEKTAEESANHFCAGATIMCVNFYPKDGNCHLLLSNSAILTFSAVDIDTGLNERLRIGILGPSVPESPHHTEREIQDE